MRGTAAMVGALITLAISAAAMGAMSADLRVAASRAQAREAALHQVLDPVWLGGQLTPIVVEGAPVAPGRAPREVVRQAPRRRITPRPSTTLRIG